MNKLSSDTTSTLPTDEKNHERRHQLIGADFDFEEPISSASHHSVDFSLNHEEHAPTEIDDVQHQTLSPTKPEKLS